MPSVLQNDNLFFSVPRNYDLVLEFDAFNKSFAVIKNNNIPLTPNQWYMYQFPEDCEGFYTSIRMIDVYYTRTNPEFGWQLDELAEYSSTMSYQDATVIETEEDGNLYAAVSANKDKIYFYTNAISDDVWSISLLSVIADVPKLTLRNENIVRESMTIEDSLCASDYELGFGRCEARSFSISVVTDGTQKLKNRWFTAYLDTSAPWNLVDSDGNHIVNDEGDQLTAQINFNTLRFTIGRFKVFSDKPKNDRMTRDLVCYDALYDINNMNVTEFLNDFFDDYLTQSPTVKLFRDSFFEYLGITQVEPLQGLVNDSFVMDLKFYYDAIVLGKDVIESICRTNGVFGHINNYGEFIYITVHNADPIEYPFYVDDSGSYEDYTTDYISGVVCIDENGAVDTRSAVGTGVNPFVIRNEDIVFHNYIGDSAKAPALKTALENIYNQIKIVSYRPFNVSSYGNPALPIGTGVILNTRNKTIKSIIMNKTLTGIQNMRDSIEAYGEKLLSDNQGLINN